MILLAIFVGLMLSLTLFVAGAHQLNVNANRQRAAVTAVTAGEVVDVDPLLTRLSRTFVSTRPGHALERQLQLAGIRQRPIVVAAATVAATFFIPYLLWHLLAPVFGVLGLAGGGLLLRFWLRHARERRREAFIQQIPELSRVLSNATNAGLSITTAWLAAEEEMSEPARSEIARINTAVRFGAPLEQAMLDVLERLPSREVRVLMSTLVVSSRSGGSLVKALRDISLTLDDRKEVRREIRTTLAQAVATGYMVIGMGFGLLLLLNTAQPGTVERMTGNVFGQVALLVSFTLFAVGFIIIRKMTRVDI